MFEKFKVCSGCVILAKHECPGEGATGRPWGSNLNTSDHTCRQSKQSTDGPSALSLCGK